MGLTFFTMRQNQKVLEQVKSLTEDNKQLSQQNKQLSEETNKNIEEVRVTLLCIGNFFNYPNRQELLITSYSPCVIENTTTGEEIMVNTGAERSAASSPEGSAQTSTDPRNSSTSSNTNTPNARQPSDNSQRPDSPPGLDGRQPQNFLERLIDGINGIVENLF